MTKNRLITTLSLTLILLVPIMVLADQEAGEQIEWQVFASGGVGTSTNMILASAVGQTATGSGSSTNFYLLEGFWQDFGVGGCCIGIRGNANSDAEDKTNVGDITFLIDYLYGSPAGPAPACRDEGNVNADAEDAINVGDITYLIDYLFGIPGGPAPQPCP